MGKKDRALRRYHYELMKARARRHWCFTMFPGDEKFADDRMVGIRARTPRPCSCWMCGNQRKYFGEVTYQEKKAAIDDGDE